MGKYNFDEIIDRHGTSCNKWEYNIPEDVVPMWVADMDFAAAPEIREAMQKRLDHPVYGYTHHSKELKDAIVSWVGRRYHWDIQRFQSRRCSCSCYESFISDNTWGSYCDHDTCLSSILLFD